MRHDQKKELVLGTLKLYQKPVFRIKTNREEAVAIQLKSHVVKLPFVYAYILGMLLTLTRGALLCSGQFRDTCLAKTLRFMVESTQS